MYFQGMCESMCDIVLLFVCMCFKSRHISLHKVFMICRENNYSTTVYYCLAYVSSSGASGVDTYEVSVKERDSVIFSHWC